MAGYCYMNGMSNNAIAAYNRGLLPISKITAKVLRKADIDIPKAFAVFLAKVEVWTPVEYHHSSKFYNIVNFYSLGELSEILEDEFGNLDGYRKQWQIAKAQKKEEKTPRRVRGLRFYGTDWISFNGILLNKYITDENGKRFSVEFCKDIEIIE